MLSGRDIVFVSSIEWDEPWQGNQDLASRLARNGNRVLYIENSGIRAPNWHDRARVASRLRAWARSAARGGTRAVEPGLWVCAPLLLPPFGTAAARTLNRRVLIPAVVRSARRLGLRDPLVWTYLPTDTALDLIARLRGECSQVVYSCIADFTAVATDTEALARCERELVDRCDVVFAQPSFVERLRRRHDRVFVYEPPISTEVLDPAANPPRPAALAGVTGPVVGYVGGLSRNLDIALVARLAKHRPDWTWVLVGPASVSVDALARLPNVRLLGALAHRELPGAIAAFDVGIAPLVMSDYTASMVPTKIGEYLAMGKPVVSTPIAHSVALARRSCGVVITAEPRPADFVAAIERALALAGDPGTVARCRALAQQRAWATCIEDMSAAVEGGAARPQTLGGERPQPADIPRAR